MKKSKKSENADNSSISIKSSRLEDLAKRIKSANKQFTQLKVQFEDTDDSESDDEQSHFQFLHFSLANHHQSALENHYHKLSMKQSQGKFADLNSRKVILLDNQSTMSLFCNNSSDHPHIL